MSVATAERGLTLPSTISDRMPGGIALSATMHLLIAALIVLGLPTLLHPPPPQDMPIAVELVTIAPETRATHPNPYRPRPHAKPEPSVADAPMPKPEPKPELPPPSPEPPPSSASPPTPSQPVPQPQPPKPELRADAPPLPMPKPQEPQAITPAKPPEPRPKPEPAKTPPKPEAKPDPKKADPAAFDALLKNLTRQAQVEDTPPQPQKMRMASVEPSSQPRAPLGAQLTASELDLIKRQIAECWNVPAGARDAQDLIIEVNVAVNPDGTVQTARIVDLGRYAADTFFRAAADSAVRAVRNPRCSPLRLPPEKYDAWRNLDLFFNPKDLL